MARILVADDDPMVREMVGELLTIRSHSVDFADNGAKTMEKLQKTAFDLVILDINMPVMNGIDAVKAIRQTPQLKDLKILMFTSNSDPALLERASAAGANGYLKKPIQLNEFSTVIRNTLG